MRFSSILALALSCASASPIEKRQASGALSANDVAVLQLALYLEHLELSLYSGGYNNFTEAQYEAAGLPFPNRENVGIIASHEATHSSTIAAVLTANGVTPVPACTYSFPYNSPPTFYGLADLITSTGIGAYLGGAELIMDNPALLTEAASILTTEARHDAYLRQGVGQSPFPMAFDTPLTATWAYNLAQPFIVKCPQQLPIPILPRLSIAPSQAPASDVVPIALGGTLNVVWTTTSTPITDTTPLYLALIAGSSGMPAYVPLTRTGTGAGSITLPNTLMGTFFAVLTSVSGGVNTTALTATGTLAGPVVFAVQSAPQ
ncbi:Putative uncharacterized protein [Taphrina deformans PYCC 5710]|uniref:Protein rds1 n=1 Tax=Taphrina deformans (strain PYCC 5710 / ATCC 11124 / CBS 356.35 / IMI 108563 / JCM 9778 / NBRC 8474) TaxID=1097556 RepID=R4X6Q6_TAPDE|nr:Putative uncharacterized protein [Taphrina deformans PYCC 5710]|eukprot:CCG80591.1 Putative uncharacterized protein [Taphrina deformans PYCC 5710]